MAFLVVFFFGGGGGGPTKPDISEWAEGELRGKIVNNKNLRKILLSSKKHITIHLYLKVRYNPSLQLQTKAGEDSLKSRYFPNYKKLMQTKKIFDPSGLFNQTQGINIHEELWKRFSLFVKFIFIWNKHPFSVID